MKQFLCLQLLLFLGTFSVCSQDISDHAIGLRFGANDGFGTEVNYQHGLGDNNRLEAGLGFNSGSSASSFRIIGLYEWVWALEGNFNWYAGAGGSLYSYKTKEKRVENITIESQSGTYIGGSGAVGIEYNFDFPLLISLDVRPEFIFGDYNNGLNFDLGIAARYRF